jgi:hypothetical protein
LIIVVLREAFGLPFLSSPFAFLIMLSGLPLTISEYWQLHGFSKEEADQIEQQQIKEAIDQEAFYDHLENNPF